MGSFPYQGYADEVRGGVAGCQYIASPTRRLSGYGGRSRNSFMHIDCSVLNRAKVKVWLAGSSRIAAMALLVIAARLIVGAGGVAGIAPLMRVLTGRAGRR